MKTSNIGSILGLAVLALLTAWLNYGTDEQPRAPRPDGATGTSSNASGTTNSGIGAEDYVLAVSWMPAFCEQRPNKPECRSQRAGRFDVANFSLHGLWPQPRDNVYCGVSQSIVRTDKQGRWRDLPKLDLSQALRDELARKMPGYRSYLHRHEWYKHGTCMHVYSPQDYFEISLKLLDDLNASPIQDLLESRIGDEIRFRDLEQAFAKAFGNRVAARVIMDCYRDDGRRILQELKLTMRGKLDERSNLARVMANGHAVGRSCPAGIIDPVGLQ